MFEFNKSGETDIHFTNINPFFFSYQFEGSEKGKGGFHNEFYLLDLYGTKYHYDSDFGRDGKIILGGVYGSKVCLNKNIGVTELKKVLQDSKKEFTDLPQAHSLSDLDIKALSESKFEIKESIPIFFTPPWHKHLCLSIFFYNDIFNFYQECLLIAEVDLSGFAINQAIGNPIFADLKVYCEKVFGIDFKINSNS